MKHCAPRNTDEFAAIAGDLDIPDAHRAACKCGGRNDGQDAFAHGSEVVCVDLNAYRRCFC